MATYNVFTPEQLYNLTKNYLIANPSSSGAWNLNSGSRVRTLVEAICLIESYTAHDYYIKLKDAIFESVMNSFGFDKKAGFQSTGTLVFSRSGTTGTVTIPIGTRIIASNGKVIETIAAGSILNGNTDSASISAQATEVGIDGNFIIDDINTLEGRGSFVDRIDDVENVRNDTAFAGGENEENDEDQLSRFRLGIQGLTTSTQTGLLRGTLSVTGVKTATIIENYPERGIVTVYADDGTGSLSGALKTEIEKVLNGDSADLTNYPGYRAAGIEISVEAPAITAVNVVVDVYRLTTPKEVTDTTLELLVQSAIESYINSRGLGEDVIITAIETAARNAHPDVYDVDVTTPSANVEIEGFYLARTGGTTGATVTVNIIDRSNP